MNDRQILEALQMQPLSEEEKSARHILGRLYGPIATSKESTRNGRHYNKELWEKALSDEIFHEKLANKSLFLELGHPTDREETDMTKVCGCIPEMPKVVDGDLYTYVDILDTDNGRLLKTLCDYGFIPGISSRGSGDIMSNDDVDPETFFLETWDIVQLPAVKKARLTVCESVDEKHLALKKALCESLSKADAKSKKIMQEALDSLNIDLTDKDEDTNSIEEENETVSITEDDGIEIEDPTVPDDLLVEASEGDEDNIEEVEDEASAVEDEPVEEPDKLESDEATYTISKLTDDLADYDENLLVEFSPVEIDGTEYQLEMLGLSLDDDNNKLVINISCKTDDNIEEIEEEDAEQAEVEDETETAVDNGDEEVIESLKEAIRKNDLLEQELKSLKSTKTVDDAKVNELTEELNKYKTAFTRVSIVAGQAKQANSEIKQLNEQLNRQLIQKDTELNKLTQDKITTTHLTESISNSTKKVTALTEQLSAVEQELSTTKTQLTEQANIYKKKLNERTEIAKAYKAKCEELTEQYLAYRASMLGVRISEIKNRLAENYTFKDIDKVCDDLLVKDTNWSKLPYGFSKESKIAMVESKSNKSNTIDSGYELNDELLELAGLK